MKASVSSQAPYPGYGYQTWVSTQEDRFSLRGNSGQSVSVHPATRTVVVHTGVYRMGSFAIAGAIGLLLLAFDGFQHFALVAVLTISVRALVMSIAGPDGGYQRYLAPVYPVLLVAGAYGLAALARRTANIGRAVGRRSDPRTHHKFVKP